MRALRTFRARWAILAVQILAQVSHETDELEFTVLEPCPRLAMHPTISCRRANLRVALRCAVNEASFLFLS